MAKNYYVILGIASDASQEQIKSAYRQLVKELHPDHYGEDSQPFREIQEAYSVLSDPERRRTYDREREQAAQPGSRQHNWRQTGRSPIEPIDARQHAVEAIFDRFFGGATFFDEFMGRMHGNRRVGLRVDVSLTAAQAHKGGEVGLNVPVDVRCPTCQGYGGGFFMQCLRCGGHGVLQAELPVTVSYPSGMSRNYVTQVSVAPGVDLTIYFRVDD